MVRWVPVVPAAAVLFIGQAGCGPSGFDVRLTPDADPSWGNGHRGDLDVGAAGEQINTCHPLVGASNGTLNLASGTLEPGDAVVVWQVQDAVASVSTASQIAIATTGRWEPARVISGAAYVYALEAPLGDVYTSGGAQRAQVCTVPEYGDVRVQSGASLVATPWNGTSGGFVGFFARGEVRINGTIDASGAGFRGTNPLGDGGGMDETALINNVAQAGGIGEGIDASLLGLAGRGNAANGGGGGGAFNAGGGGGGNAGRGGEGASQSEGTTGTADTSGYGGAALLDGGGRFAFGGGGGSGHQNDELGGGGGNGGGVVWVRAFILRGEGTFDASGLAGEDSAIAGTTTDGAGGGGAGGTVIVESDAWNFHGSVRALGGAGGSVARPNKRGVGGGGGGGRVTLPLDANLVPLLAGGAPGVNSTGSSLDATAGEPVQ